MPRLAFTTAFSVALTGSAMAQPHDGRGRHGATPPQASPQEPASTTQFRGANARMHEDMAIPYSGPADRDFAASMIPHHQGAIDMARSELAHGRDPAMRRIAEQIIVAQEAEIVTLRAFLARPVPPAR